MKHLNKIFKYKIFTFNDFVKIINDKNLANITLRNYIKKGYIKRIKHNLYSPISLETNDILADKYLIGSSLTDNSFISHHSAFEFYGYYNQISAQVSVSSISKFTPFEFEDNSYSFINTKTNIFVDEIRNIRVSTIERTIVDCIKDSGKYCDLEETLNSINLIPYININDILEYLEIINSKILYKKTGAILSLFKEKFNIPDSFFKKCHDISDSVKGHFDNNSYSHVYNAEWKIFIYKDLINYINKE